MYVGLRRRTLKRRSNKMMMGKKMMRGKKRMRSKRQKGGIFPLAALIPALIAGGKAVALGAASGAAGFSAKKALEAATRRR